MGVRVSVRGRGRLRVGGNLERMLQPMARSICPAAPFSRLPPIALGNLEHSGRVRARPHRFSYDIRVNIWWVQG